VLEPLLVRELEQQNYQVVIGARRLRAAKIAAAVRAKIPGQIGWHTLRHSYRAWLDETGAPLGVQQKLMRHANISTTMNVYGGAFMKAKRKANTSVVQRLLLQGQTK
jgi:integrase